MGYGPVLIRLYYTGSVNGFRFYRTGDGGCIFPKNSVNNSIVPCPGFMSMCLVAGVEGVHTETLDVTCPCVFVDFKLMI